MSWFLSFVVLIVQGIAIIGEFCCRWLISVFDISVAQFAEEQHSMSSFEFSMASGLGSVINTIQTGWLFNKFLAWDVSIPLITCLSGVAGGTIFNDMMIQLLESRSAFSHVRKKRISLHLSSFLLLMVLLHLLLLRFCLYDLK